MVHHLQHIADLVEICRLKGIEQVVVSPGSRNAPLIRLFANEKSFRLHSIVDERSAAFYGLGISLATQKLVVLLCTSGTAVLNYAPALAEAYYQHIPLIAITADRPEELIDQQDNQTIHQKNIFQNYIKASLNLVLPVQSSAELEAMHLTINNIINISSEDIKGPVHINVPIAEPLYVDIPKPSKISVLSEKKKNTNLVDNEIISSWRKAQKRMILCGQIPVNKELNELFGIISAQNHAVILAEPISNINGGKIISAIERTMLIVESDDSPEYQPDLLVSIGGPVVSKRLKQWLQKQTGLTHYRISETEDRIDTYQNLTKNVIGEPLEIITALLEMQDVSEEYFLKKWENVASISFERQNEFLVNVPFSDLKVFDFVINNLSKDCVLHLGNSSPIRYGQLFDLSGCSVVCSNRGVSGIDGCLSTAAGFASQSDQINIIILGDLSFLYDSNGLWNRELSPNLRIIVINNQGGGIFSLISGASDENYFKEFMEAYHPVDLEKLTVSYGVNYYQANCQNELDRIFKQFLNFNGPSLLEIKTPKEENPIVFKEHIRKIKTNKS
mgnify:CR=1 FL=1